MAVRKMRHVGEASTPHAAPLQPENLRSAFELSEVGFRLHPYQIRRGVHRYRSIEAAQDPDGLGASPKS